MSYSFTVRASTKAEAEAAAAAKFDEHVAQQPVHQHDRAAVLANVSAVLSHMADDDTKDVAVSCHGYVSWTEGGATSLSIATSASLVSREA